MTAREVGDKLGISRDKVYKAMKRCGVKGHSKRIPTPSGVVERYERGESVLELSNRYGVSRSVVNRWLDNAGIVRRSYAAAGKLRAAKMSPEDRAAQARAAHEANRGKRATTISRVRRARTRQGIATIEKCSHGERLIADYLTSNGFDVTLEKAVHVYNLDIAIGEHFAIEVCGGNFHGDIKRRTSDAERLEYLLGAGWTIVYVWDTKNIPITTAAAEKCVSIFNAFSFDPTVDGEYWVIRGDGEVATRASRNVNYDSLKLPSQKRVGINRP